MGTLRFARPTALDKINIPLNAGIERPCVCRHVPWRASIVHQILHRALGAARLERRPC